MKAARDKNKTAPWHDYLDSSNNRTRVQIPQNINSTGPNKKRITVQKPEKINRGGAIIWNSRVFCIFQPHCSQQMTVRKLLQRNLDHVSNLKGAELQAVLVAPSPCLSSGRRCMRTELSVIQLSKHSSNLLNATCDMPNHWFFWLCSTRAPVISTNQKWQ